MAVAACSIYKVKMMRDEMRAHKFSILNLIENKDDSWEKFLVFMLQYFLFVLTSKSWTINSLYWSRSLTRRKNNNELTHLELRHLGGEALHHCGLPPPVLVDGEHHEPQVAPGVEASDEEHGLDVADVGEHDLGDHINHLQHEDLVQTPVKASLASENRENTDKSY